MSNQFIKPNLIPAWLRNRWSFVLLGFTLYLGVYLLWILFHNPADPSTLVIGDLANIPLSAFAAVSALRVVRNPLLNSATRRAWSILALAFASTMIGDSIWFYYEVILHTAPFPSAADVFYLATNILLFAGMVLFPTKRLEQHERSTFWLDLTIVMIAAWMLIWYFIVIPAATASSSDLLSQILAAIYPIADLLVLAGMPAILLRRPAANIRTALVIFILGVVSFFVADVAFAITTQNGTYVTGSLIDFLWPLGFILFSVSAAHQMKFDSEIETTTSLWLERLVRILPYVAVLTGLGMFAYLFSTLDLTNTSLWPLYLGILLLLLLAALRVATNQTGMQKSIPQFQQAEPSYQLQERAARFITSFSVLAAATAASVYLYSALQLGEWQLYGWSADIWVLTAAILVSAVLVRRGRVQAGIWIMLVSTSITFLIAPTLIAGIGLVVGTSLTLLIIIIASATLPSKQASWAAYLGIISGIIAILIDVLQLPNRLPVPDPLEVFLIAILSLVTLVFSFFFIKQFRDYSLRVKFITAFTLVSMLSVGVVGLIIGRAFLVNLNATVQERLANTARLTSVNIGDELDIQVSILRSFALNHALDSGLKSANAAASSDLAELERLDRQWQTASETGNDSHPLIHGVLNHPLSVELRRLRIAFPDHVEAFVTDRFGANVAATSRTSDYYQADEEWWQAAFNNGQGDVYISQPEFDESSQTFGFQIAVPVLNEKSEVAGVLRTTVALSVLTEVLEAGRFGQTGRTEIYLPNGMELELEPKVDGKFELVYKEAASDIIVALQQGETLLESTHDGVPSLGGQFLLTRAGEGAPETATAIDDLGWRIVAAQDSTEALLPVTEATRTIQFAGLGALLMAGILALVVAQFLTAPITNLTETAEKVSSGDLEARAHVASRDEIGVLTATFNTMTARLQQNLGGLEKRVAERTADLNASRIQSEERAQDLQSISEISRIILSEQRLDVLLPLITSLTSEKFEFYHTGIFLVDDSRRFAVLHASNSEGGQRMLNRGHRLEFGKGIVGNVASTGKARIALNVGVDALFTNNPDLPSTRSEMALPLNVRGQTIGVLDVQSTKSGEFTENESNTLGILADLIAIAIENARLFAKTQQALDEVQTLYNQYLQKEWKAFRTNAVIVGYQQSLTGGKPIETLVESEDIRKALQMGETLVVNENETLTESAMVVPVKLRGQTIGVLHIKAPVKGHQWSKDEINLIQSVSDRLALALENARLFEETNKRAERERIVSDITGKIRSVNDPQEMIQTAMEELRIALGASRVQIIPQVVNEME